MYIAYISLSLSLSLFIAAYIYIYIYIGMHHEIFVLSNMYARSFMIDTMFDTIFDTTCLTTCLLSNALPDMSVEPLPSYVVAVRFVKAVDRSTTTMVQLPARNIHTMAPTRVITKYTKITKYEL